MPTDPRLAFDINLGGQLDRFMQDYGTTDLSDTTAVVLIGANDYGAIDLGTGSPVQDAIATVLQVAASTYAAATSLIDAGVGTVVLSTLPSVTFFPAFVDADPVETLAIDVVFSAHNQFLRSMAEQLSGPDADVRILDTEAMTYAIAEDPTGFGLIAPYTLTQEDSAVLDDFDNDQVAFWDDVHPSTATHGVLGAHNAHFLNDGSIVALTDRRDQATLGGDDDLVLAYGKSDVVNGGAGTDTVFGGTGKDVLRGQDDDDILSGGADNDRLSGGRHQDVLDGDGGDDIVRGNRGQDILIDGLGSDTVLGGSGDDTFIFTQASLIGGTDGADSDEFDGGNGTDTLYLVLDTDMAAELSSELLGADPTSALAALGITASNIENIEVLVERSSLSSFSGESWYAAADIWGLI